MNLADTGFLLVTVQDRTSESGWGIHPMWWMWGVSGLVMMVMMLVFWAVVIAGLVLLGRWLLGQGRERPDRAPASLRERYARGDINREEFEARKRDLEA